MQWFSSESNTSSDLHCCLQAAAAYVEKFQLTGVACGPKLE
jgi:hypothetical protein